jgi:antitoxin component YwqK of YwqJK toxin-antitoxin module
MFPTNAPKPQKLDFLRGLGNEGPRALTAVPEIRQVLNESDPALRQAAREALNRILAPVDDSGYFFQIDPRSDLQKKNLYGPVKRVTWSNFENLGRRRGTFDKQGNLLEEVFYRGGQVDHTRVYTRDSQGRQTEEKNISTNGITLDRETIAWDARGNRIEEVFFDPQTLQPSEKRLYTYDHDSGLVRYEDFKDMQLEPLALEFSLDEKGRVLQRRVLRERLAPVEVTRLEYDARGNTTAKWEYVDNLPLQDAGIVFIQPGSPDYSPRQVLKYLWQYEANDKDEIYEKRLYWMEGLLEKKQVLDYDENRNVSREVDWDDEGAILSDMNFKWDNNKNLVSRSGTVYANKKGEMESYSYLYDKWGNWTQKMGIRPDFKKAPTRTREFEYYEK